MKLKKIGLSAAASLMVLIGAVAFLPLRAIAGLESPCNYISDLVSTNPLSSDLASTGDDHMRCIKLALKTTFPNLNGAVSATDEQLSAIASGTPEYEAAAPRIILDETDAASNERIYDFASSSGQLLGRTRTDADGAGASWLTVDRTGTTVDSIAFAATALTQTNGTATGAIMKLSSDSTAGTAGLAVCATDESATNECYFMGMGAGADLQIGKASDAGARATSAISVTSTGTTIDTVNLSATAVQTNGVDITAASGSFTCTATGFSGTVNGTCFYSKQGNQVTLSIPFMTGTSNAATFTITGLPAAIDGARDQFIPMKVTDNSSNCTNTSCGVRVGSSTTVTVFLNFSSVGWTSSGVKSICATEFTPCSVTYLLN